LVANQKGSGDPKKANGYSRVMDKGQQMTYATMQQFKREAQAATSDGRTDWSTAFDRYGKILQFADADQMKKVRDAQLIRQEANDAITGIHEVLVIQTLLRATQQGEMSAKDKADRIAKDLRA